MTPHEYSMLIAELEAEASPKPVRSVLAPLPASFVASAENVQRIVAPSRAPRAAKAKASDVKFGPHLVRRGPNRARISYSTGSIYLKGGGGKVDPRKVVTLYAKDYSGSLGKVFPDLYANETDLLSDSFDKGEVHIFEESPYYSAALRAALDAKSKSEERWAKTLKRRRTKLLRHSR